MRQRFADFLSLRAMGALALITASITTSQAGDDGKSWGSPAPIARQGSFFIGGDSVFAGHAFGSPDNSLSGHITVNQMYVSYQMPFDARNRYPIVLIHGGDLSGATYETTPDGRMGWAEYFLRSGRGVYVPDQVARARSGFDLRAINEVRLGLRPITDLPILFVVPDELAWTFFRFGPQPGVPYPDAKFPVQAAAEFSKQVVPDFNNSLPGDSTDPIPTIANLSTLVGNIHGAIVLGHSQAGVFPFDVALKNPTNVKAAIAIEPGPGDCNNSKYSDQQVEILAKIPILVEFGDHLDAIPSWQSTFTACKAFILRVNKAGGNAKMLHPPELGIRGNSHMIMQDTNNLQIAGIISDWIDKNVRRK